MTTFEQREKAYEDKFAHDEELRFKVNVKTAALLGEWAAKQIGLSPDVYVKELVNLVTGGKSEEALLDKVATDAVNKGKHLSIDALKEKYTELQNQAKEHVINH